MNSDQLTYTIALTQLFLNRSRKLRELFKVCPTPQEAWERIQMTGKQQALDRAKREQEFINKHHINTYFLKDDNYPRLLAQCPDAPVLLYAKGNINLTDGHFISIVGTRQATERGKINTRDLVLELANRLPKLTIISGLAYGIDIAAHRAALEAGIPTLIIPAHGLDRIYPPLHRPEAIRALENGGILTEYMTETIPEKQNFVARNRIVAGLAECTIVMESRARGGALITASMAFDYNRPVFAVPGRINDDSSAGCNALIRDHKASLIQHPDDLIQAMLWDNDRKPVQQTLPGLNSDIELNLSTQQHTILMLLREADEGMLINELVEETQIAYSDVITELMYLEMKKCIKSLPGGKFMAL